MIKTKEDLKFYLQEDINQNGYQGGLGFWSVFKGGEKAVICRYLKLLRYGEYHLNNSSNPYHWLMYSFYRLRKRHMSVKYHLYVPFNVTGYGLRIQHIIGGGVGLGLEKCGNYCSFDAGGLFGNNGLGSGRPLLGDHVSFGAGSKAFGGITIGSNVYVSPNVIVMKDVPCDRVVLPSKVRITPKDVL